MPDEGHLRVILSEDMVITPPLMRGAAFCANCLPGRSGGRLSQKQEKVKGAAVERTPELSLPSGRRGGMRQWISPTFEFSFAASLEFNFAPSLWPPAPSESRPPGKKRHGK